MKITVSHQNPENPIDDRMEMEVDNKLAFSVGNLAECPEDANLGRDLAFAANIPAMLRQAYSAGKKQEGLIIETKDFNTEEIVDTISA